MRKFLIIFGLLTLTLVASAQSTQTKTLALFWEADAYVPPLYEGKALPGPEVEIRVISLPPAGAVLEYSWTLDGEKTPGDSSILTFKAKANRRAQTVAVTALERATRTVWRGAATVPVAAPRLALYERDPLAGLWYQRALGEKYELSGPEVTFSAVPYYFSRAEVSAGQVEYQWRLNGQIVVGSASSTDAVTFTAPASGASLNNIVEVSAKNLKHLLQSAQTRLILNIDNQNNYNF